MIPPSDISDRLVVIIGIMILIRKIIFLLILTAVTVAAPSVAQAAGAAQALPDGPETDVEVGDGRVKPIRGYYFFDGEDGELIYDGFVVYTEKGADYETVYAVF